MTANQRQDLDEMLRRWAKARNAAEPELDELAARIAAAAASEPYLEVPALPQPPKRRWLTPALLSMCGALAASLLFSIWLGRSAQPTGSPTAANGLKPASSAPSLAVWTPAELAEKRRLLTAVDAEFGGHLAWLAEQGKDVSLQVNDAQQPDPGRPLAIRIVMLHRQRGASQWREVWTTDVVTHSEQMVDALPGTAEAMVWAYALPDGTISIDTDLTLEVPLRARVRFSGLLKSGIPGQVFSLETAEDEYRIYQTAVVLPDDTA